MNSTELAAVIAAIIMALVMGFQLLLAAGLPFAEASWGGRYQGMLPRRLRWASLASVGVIGLSAWVVLARAGLVEPGAQPVAIRIAAWGFAGFLAVNTLGNLASKSRVERMVMTPASAISSVCFVLVALS